MAKPGPKPKGKATQTCSNCLSHRAGNAKGLYSGKPVCHFYPEPTVCRSVDHWCRQWEPENGKGFSPDAQGMVPIKDGDSTHTPLA